MTFTVEDGTGKSDANSGVSVEDADEYFTDRQISGWVGEDHIKQGALIRATDYIEMRFSSRFRWDREFPDVQALSFPRTNNDVNPPVVLGVLQGYKRAVFEYALRALNGPLAPDPTVAASGLAVIAESHKAGPVTDTFRYASKGEGATPMIFKPYPTADALIAPLLRKTSGLIR